MQLTDLPGPSGALTARCKPTSVSAVIQHQPLSTPPKILMRTIPGLGGTSWRATRSPGFSPVAETHFFRLIQKDWSGRTVEAWRPHFPRQACWLFPPLFYASLKISCSPTGDMNFVTHSWLSMGAGWSMDSTSNVLYPNHGILLYL